jgi:hypothetical protein
MRRTAAFALAGICCTAAFAQQAGADRPPRSAVSDTPAPGVVRAPLQPREYDGHPLARLFLDLYGGTGSADEDRALRRRIDRLAQPIAAGTFSPPVAERALAEIRSLAGVRDASYSLYASERPGEVVLVVTATLAAGEKPAARGAMVTGAASDLPVLLEDERTLLRIQLSGGLGAYADHNPWFASPGTYTSRSPIAKDPPGAGWAQWAEAWVEYGAAGATRLGDTPAYAFGEATLLTSGAVGQDLFTSDTRTKTLPEKAYAGVLWAQPGTQRAAKLSVGRQNWQLNNGFLFSKFSGGANAGPNPALFLNPRTTYEMAVLAEFKAGRFRAEYFDVDPAELKDFDSRTRFQGVHVSWIDRDAWDLGAAAYRVLVSDTVFRTQQGDAVRRDGQRTWNLRAGHKAVGGVAGLSALAEYAFQDHADQDVSARAWYAQFGYTARELPWAPSLTYRYASFSGDDPNTSRREAFDAPLSSGLDEWVQGVVFKKVVTNSNVNSHRVRLNLAPSARLNYTIDWFRLWADVPSATGAKAYGDEIDFAVRWAISKRWYFLGVAGIAWPDEVIKQQTGGVAKPWATVQASLFWGF